MTILMPLLVGALYVCLNSLIREPQRRRFNAIMVAGAGAAYLSGGGLAGWEFPFVAVLAYVAYRGLESWRWIGVGWLLHTGWDVVHHLYGNPIIPFLPGSSFGCAICDPVIALWCLTGGWSVRDLQQARTIRRAGPAAASRTS
ncbi:hypothetical protein C1I95_23435 [Micromonospora craterilacus]|uniref:Integral membrane protein n=1 Tax=Micromonospora craterilacus TaxID=1655439 RepID=A0A2W2DTK2_9ACTN|nr:DUF6010 family protein [Micromonospora craterilacus]PZG13551.1 hypothetical protein C1I95_23435 [Micromonospora craterilacus]